MLRLEQIKWLEHLRDDDRIVIKPFDPTAEQKYQVVKKKIQDVLGGELAVFHCGASSLGISGQDEVDVYIPVPPRRFNELILPLSALFGSPKSHYPLERARFVTEVEGKHIDVFLINELGRGWVDGRKFEEYLKQHPDMLEVYRRLKEEWNGLSTQKYYWRKTEFINDILAKADAT